MAKSFTPDGFHTVTPYLIVEGAARLLHFAQHAFDAVELMRMPGPDGGIMHAAMRLGDSIVELSDANANWPAMPGSLHVYVPDIDATYAKALEAGADSITDPADMFYGERSATVRDPVGNLWHIATHLEDVSLEEIARRATSYEG